MSAHRLRAAPPASFVAPSRITLDLGRATTYNVDSTLFLPHDSPAQFGRRASCYPTPGHHCLTELPRTPMIYDCLENAELYFAVHPGFARAFEYLRTTDFTKLETGRNEIDGERLFVMVNRDTGQGREKRKLEFHRKYIDIQYVVEGTDEIGWRSLSHCKQLDTEYSATPDVGFYRDPAESYFQVSVGEFAIFYPSDPHAPLSGRDKMLKPVVKVAVDWQ